ncbi:MAG: peptide deformylase [Elusimicrobia bacterium]|nr:peptide deformylase [Elusimicrobiota bacterium]
MNDLIIWPDQRLKQKSEPIPESMFGEELDKLFNKMELTMKKYRGIGISAIQIGIPLQAMIVTNVENGKLYKMVNPVIEKETEDRKMIYTSEGCLSFPSLNVPVWRFEDCTVKFTSPSGKEENVYIMDPLAARCAQHEYDHLLGITMLSHLSSVALSRTKEKYSKILRKMDISFKYEDL